MGEACQKSLDGFKTTMAFDKKRLNDETIQNTEVKNAVLSRLGEKIVLDFYIRCCDSLIKKIASIKNKMYSMDINDKNAGGWNNEYMWEYRTARDQFIQKNLIQDVDF